LNGTRLSDYRWFLLLLVPLAGLLIFRTETGAEAARITGLNILTVLQILPPVLILVGLLDVWVPREIMLRHMGEEAGIRGFLLAFLLGSVAAGPLYVAFPIAALLARKGARLAVILYFVGTWISAKLPLVMFEAANLGWSFTLIHLAVSQVFYLAGALVIEKLVNRGRVIETLSACAD